MKFAVVGSSCAGKTTVSREIAEKLNLNCTQIDAVFWQPNWREKPENDFRRIIDELTSKDSWVVDGCYTRLHDLTLGRAEVIVWLNYSFTRVFRQAFLRTVKRAAKKTEIFSGCRESFYLSFFTRESILWWVLTTWKRKRTQYRKIFDEKTFGDKEYVELRTRKETERYLDELKT
ncbi:adenylate kinase [bacterium]|nr:adenylate kinase [bacterium]